MKIIVKQAYIDVEHNGKTARFAGYLAQKGFAAEASTMRWLRPAENAPVTEEERLELMRTVREFAKTDENKVYFIDDNCNNLDF